MNCEDTRRALDTAFDTETGPDPLAAAHARRCPACAAHAARLAFIDTGLRAEVCPDDMPRDLPVRIKARIAREARPGEPAAIHWGVGVAVCLALAAAAWWYAPDARFGWPGLETWRDADTWRAVGEPFATPFRELWAMVAPLIENSAGLVPGVWLWGVAGAAAVVLVLFNAYEARSLETAGSHTRRRPRG